MDTSEQKAALMTISVSIAFVKFCGIVLWNIMQTIITTSRKERNKANTDPENRRQQPQQKSITCIVETKDDQFRNSILEDTPLLEDKSTEY